MHGKTRQTRVNTGGFSFNFTDALDAFVFDETDKTKPNYHGLPMKAVDIVVEFQNEYVFVEVKDISKHRSRKSLTNSLKYKYRDSYLFRHAENKVEKPVHYICLLACFDNAQNLFIQNKLIRELPVGKKSKRWKRSIVESCQVLSEQTWKDSFSEWHLERV